MTAKTDIEMHWASEMGDVLRDNARLIADLEKQDKSLQGVARSAGKAGEAMRKSTGDARKGAKGVTTEMTGVEKATAAAATQAANYVKGFVGIGGILMTVRALTQQLAEQRSLQKEMLGTAVGFEGQALKIAHLRGDVSPTGIKGAQSSISQIAMANKVPLDVAASTLFFAESSMGAGSPAAYSAAQSITEFAGAAGLTADEVQQIPKLFGALKADTPKKQKAVLNQLKEAAGRSIAETGEYTQNYIPTAVSDIERGYTLPQSLSRFTAMIDTTGSVAEASTQSQRLADITAGRNEKALEFLTKQATRRGQDFGAMDDPARLQFGRQIYQEFKAAGRMDDLKTQLDVKGFAAMRAGFSETATRKYADTLPAVTAAAGSDQVQQMAKQYQSTLTAQTAARETQRVLSEAEAGRQRAALADFNAMVDDIHKQSKMNARGVGNNLSLALMPESFEKKTIADSLIRESLARERFKAEAAGDPERLRRIQSMQFNMPDVLTQQPGYIEDVFNMTDGFSDVAGDPRMKYSRPGGAFEKGIEAYFESLIAATRENTEELKQLNGKVPEATGPVMED